MIRARQLVSAIACWCSHRDRVASPKKFASTFRGRETSTTMRSALTPVRSWRNWKAKRMKSDQVKRTAIYVTFFYVLLFAAWQVLFSAGVIPEYLFPSPLQVARRLWELGADNYLLPSITSTLSRMLIGFGISAAIGLLV